VVDELLEKMKARAAAKAGGKPGSALSGKEIQVQPYVCGFCNSGFHFRSKRPRGPVCKFIYDLGRYGIVVCKCDCTKTERDFREMLRAAGKDVPGESEPMFVLPAPSLRGPVTVDAGVPDDAVTPDAPDDADPEPADTAVMRFSFGETGRVEKGQLEDAVWRVCKEALDGKIPVPSSGLTPLWVSFEVTLRTGTEYKPSPGAVSAVMDRWSKVVWAEVETKPMRLIKMSDQFYKLGPSGMKNNMADALKRTLRRF